jgi:F-type H+-transporting ATPase subunit delta
VTKRTAALRYARALFDVALQEKADLSQIEEQLASFGTLLTTHPLLEKVLLNPAVPVPRKRAATVELTKLITLSPIVSKLLIMLAERDRFVLLPDLIPAFRDRLADYQQVVRADVTTALALSPERIESIRRSLSKTTGRSVTLTARVDATLIGGLVARVGGTVFDASLSTQLHKLKQSLTN